MESTRGGLFCTALPYTTKFGVVCCLLERVQRTYSVTANNSIELLHFINRDLYLVSRRREFPKQSLFAPLSQMLPGALEKLFQPLPPHLPFLGTNGGSHFYLGSKMRQSFVVFAVRFNKFFCSRRQRCFYCWFQAVLQAVPAA